MDIVVAFSGAAPVPDLDKYDVSVRMTGNGDQDGGRPIFVLTEKAPTHPEAGEEAFQDGHEGADLDQDGEPEGNL